MRLEPSNAALWQRAAVAARRAGQPVTAGLYWLGGQTVAVVVPVPDPRTKWLSPWSTFSQTGDKQWRENRLLGTKAISEFREVARTAEYVELYDKSRDIGIRLFDKKAEIKQPGTTVFVFFAVGGP